MVRTILKIILPIVVIGVSVMAARAVVESAPKKQPRPPVAYVPPVEVLVAEPAARQLDVEVHGSVHPRTQISLLARVAGRLEYTAPCLKAGGFFDEGEVLARIEKADYELAKTQAEAVVAQARAALDREKAEADIAKREWDRYGKGEPNALVLREPQLAEAEAMLASAKARPRGGGAESEADRDPGAVRRPGARGDRRRRAVRRRRDAPGDDLRDRLRRGAAVRSAGPPGLARSAARRPRRGRAERGRRLVAAGRVVLRSEFAGRQVEWRGTVVRTEAELDPRSRVIYVRVRVDDPFGREDASRPPLLVGMYVRAVLPGRRVDDVFVLPAAALRDGDRIALVERTPVETEPGEPARTEDRLVLREVEVLRRGPREMLVRSGVEAGDRIVVTRLQTVIEGMRVSVPEDEQ
jgi:multidrug efflux system membrane fusion protein